MKISQRLCSWFRLASQPPPLRRNQIEKFYRGKTVNMFIGSNIGGGYDNYARLLARHLGKHIPGNPSIVTQNIPGAGGHKAASYVAFQAAKDGTAFGAIQHGVPLAPLLYHQPLQHDPSTFIYLGSANLNPISVSSVTTRRPRRFRTRSAPRWSWAPVLTPPRRAIFRPCSTISCVRG